MRTPISWVPTAYLAEGIPFALVAWTATTLFKDLGYTDGEITGPVGTILLIWSLKPLYVALLSCRSKRFWVIACEALMASTLAMCGLALQFPDPYVPMLALLSVVALAGATHDICVDGIYLTALDKPTQARWIGWQGAFWTTGRIFAASVVVATAGVLQQNGWNARTAWSVAFVGVSAIMASLAAFHFRNLPVEGPEPSRRTDSSMATVVESWLDFLRKPHIVGMLSFVFFYRFAEGFLLLETPLFMQSGLSDGGLGMCATSALTPDCPHFLSDKAAIEGFLSTTVSLVFGILGGKFAERKGLDNRLLLFMAVCINVPTLTLVYLSHLSAQGAETPLYVIAVLVSIEKAGYSFGFVANMLYILQQIAPGKYPMVHYALCTALMNAAIVPTQAASGYLAHVLGYQTYFLFVVATTIPSFLVAWKAPFDGGVPPAATPRLV